jgi:dolichol-phosphate mannosyltransferase
MPSWSIFHASAAKATRKTMVILVLPVFNEALNLGRLFERIGRALGDSATVYRIVAVDDGSTDATPQILDGLRQEMPLQVLRHEVNQGLGIAIRTGVTNALRLCSADDVIVTMDGDDSHSPSLVREMLVEMDAGADVVIASRFRRDSRCIGVPLRRKVLSAGASIFFRTFFPTQGVRDFTCGFRAYRASALRQAQEKYELFEFEGFQSTVDILLKLRALGARFVEVPVVLRYDLKQGNSKMRIFRTVTRTLNLAVRRRLGF